MPADLGVHGRALWARLSKAYALDDEHGRVVLEQACKALDRAEGARKILDTDGAVVRDRWGQARAHPAATIERDARAQVLAALRALQLPISETL